MSAYPSPSTAGLCPQDCAPSAMPITTSTHTKPARVNSEQAPSPAPTTHGIPCPPHPHPVQRVTKRISAIPVPTTLKQAQACSEAPYWEKSCNTELDQLEQTGTIVYVPATEVPKGTTYLDSPSIYGWENAILTERHVSLILLDYFGNDLTGMNSLSTDVCLL